MQCQSDNTAFCYRVCETLSLRGWFLANKNSQDTTAPNHCVDCNCLKQSRRLTNCSLEGGGSQISIVANFRKWAQAFLHSHSCESCNKMLLFEVERNCNGLSRDVNLFGGRILDKIYPTILFPLFLSLSLIHFLT
jgi:hypothetical protein